MEVDDRFIPENPVDTTGELRLKIRELEFKINELNRFENLNVTIEEEILEGKKNVAGELDNANESRQEANVPKVETRTLNARQAEQLLKIQELKLRITDLQVPAHKKLSTYTSMIAIVIALLGVLGQFILSGIKTENAKRDAVKITDAANVTKDSALTAVKVADSIYKAEKANTYLEETRNTELHKESDALSIKIDSLFGIWNEVKDKVPAATAMKFSKIVSNSKKVSAANIPLINLKSNQAIIVNPASNNSNEVKQIDNKEVPSVQEKKQDQPTSISPAVDYPDDPQKGKWLLKAERNYRKMSATVVPARKSGQYDVVITVESTNSQYPLTGQVTFHLHNTYLRPNPAVDVIDGKAVLSIPAYGAFTVGAEADNGNTKLEYDLMDVPNPPKGFLEH